MSLMSSIATSLAGLQTTSSLIQMASDNISNAGTAGYTKKSAVLESTAIGLNSTLVSISGYSRSADDATLKALVASTTDQGSLGTMNTYYQQVETILASGDTSTTTSLADYVSSFASAWSTLQSEPESTTAQQGVIAAGKNLATAIQTTSNNIENLNRTVTSDVTTTVSTLNTDLQKISSYNVMIVNALSTGASAGDLQDSRDALVLDVAKITGVTTVAHANGSISVFTKGGYEMVSATGNKTFSYDGTNVVSTEDPSTSLNNTLVSGSLQAELNFIDTSTTAANSTTDGVGTIAKLRSMMDTVVTAFTSTTSSFATSYNTTGSTSNDFFYAGGATMDRTNITVNSALVDGSMTLITDTASAVADTFNDSTMSFTASGLSLSNCSYETLASSIISYFQSSAANVSDLSSTATSQTTTLATSYANATGVNTDEELVKLTTLENAYNASAKVISTVNEMFATLEAMF